MTQEMMLVKTAILEASEVRQMATDMNEVADILSELSFRVRRREAEEMAEIAAMTEEVARRLERIAGKL